MRVAFPLSLAVLSCALAFASGRTGATSGQSVRGSFADGSIFKVSFDRAAELVDESSEITTAVSVRVELSSASLRNPHGARFVLINHCEETGGTSYEGVFECDARATNAEGSAFETEYPAKCRVTGDPYAGGLTVQGRNGGELTLHASYREGREVRCSQQLAVSIGEQWLKTSSGQSNADFQL